MFGLDIADIIVIAVYFIGIIYIGLRSMVKIKDQEDYFLAGRRFGKLIQTFAAFGQATSTDSAVAVATTTFRDGAGGIAAGMIMIFATPIYWMISPWYRRMRVLTLGDFFQERYGSPTMSAAYALVWSFSFMLILSVGFNAIGKTTLALTPKQQSQFTEEQQQEYARAVELEQLEQEDYSLLTVSQKSRLETLRQERPGKLFSHLSKSMLIIVISIVVVIYAVAGGLEAAYLTDTVQGIGIILLSVILIPFVLIRTNQVYGGSGLLEPFEILHDKLPESFFEVFGSPSNIQFTWYYLLAIMIMCTINVAVQPNQLTANASAKDENTARSGFTIGLYLKRFCTVLWGVVALFTVLLYSDSVRDPDLVWGYTSRDLLGGMGIGLVGLMFACLIAALMSTADALMITASGLLTHSFYRQIMPNRSEKHYVFVGRIFGVVVVFGGALLALSFQSLLQQIKLTWEIGIVFAAPFWLGILWRKTNKKSAWAAILVSLVVFFVIPVGLPLINPGLRTNQYLLRQTNPAPVQRQYTAREMDVQIRDKKITEWEQFSLEEKAVNVKPEPIQIGQVFTKVYQQPKKSIFWTEGIQIDKNGQARGKGMLNITLILYEKLGADLSKQSYAMNETLRIIGRIVIPFLFLIIVSYFSKEDDREMLNRFFAKMKTKVIADRAEDQRQLQISYENPHRFDHTKVFPNSKWEFCKWDREDIIGFSVSFVIAFAIIGVLYLLVNLGR